MTATELNPTLYVEYSLNGTDWVSLLSKTESFNIKDSGIYKVAQCELKLYNKGGYFSTYALNSYLRVRADVRGVIDTLFYGKTKIPKSESDGKKEHLTVTARGRLNKLLQDAKTYKYGDAVLNGVHQWNLLETLQNAFTYPDSTHDCGVGIEASGTITTMLMKENFDRKTLLDCVQAICEYCAYTGWDDYTVDHADLILEPVGTTLTSPLIEIPAEPLERSYERNIDDAYNHILVFPAINIYFPSIDFWCEGGYALGYWTGLEGTVVTDDTSVVYYGSKSIKGVKTTNLTTQASQLQLDLTQTFASGFDCSTYFILDMNLPYYFDSDATSYGVDNAYVTLTDTNNKTISCWLPNDSQRAWHQYTIPIGTVSANGVWIPKSISVTEIWSNAFAWFGDLDFNWIVTKITVRSRKALIGGSYLKEYVDQLYFTSAISVDPTINTSLQVSDESYATAYDRNVLNIDAPELSDYMFITTYGTSILNVVKNPIIKLTVKHGAKTWARAGQTVHVASMPCYGLSNWYGRIVDLEFDYKAETKMLHSIFTLTPRYQPMTSKEWYKGTLAGLLTYRQW